jgi:hypothetical protein
MNPTFKLVPILLAPLAPWLLVGCGASSTTTKSTGPQAGPEATTTAADTAATAAPTASPTEAAGAGSAEAGAKPVAIKSKIEQCADLGNGMQLGQKIGPIANVNDGPKLKQMAGELRKGSDELDKLTIGNRDLSPIRGDYVDTMRGMAEALDAAAGAKDSAAQKAAVERFRKLEPKLNELIGQLNTVCNASSK